MTDAKKNELASLKIHEKAFAQSVAEKEARGDANFSVLGQEKGNLANIRRMIAEIEASDVLPAPAPAPPPES